MLLVTVAAAAVTAQKPPNLLLLVGAAFSIAAATFFPALVLGVFWKRANRWGASLGMLAGLGLTAYYMAIAEPWLRGLLGLSSTPQLWWGIQPVSAAIFGVPAGLCGDRRRQPADARAGRRQPGLCGAAALSGPARRRYSLTITCRATV